MRCDGCRFTGGPSQINRSSGTAGPQNFAFNNSKFVNTSVAIANASFGKFDGSTFSNSFVNLTSAPNLCFNHTTWRNLSGIAIQFADANSNNGSFLGANFASTVTTPYTANFGGVTGWIHEGNQGSENHPMSSDRSNLQVHFITNSGDTSAHSWSWVANQSAYSTLKALVSTSKYDTANDEPILAGSIREPDRAGSSNSQPSGDLCRQRRDVLRHADLRRLARQHAENHAHGQSNVVDALECYCGPAIELHHMPRCRRQYTFAWPTNVKGGMTVGLPALTCSAQSLIYDGTIAYATATGVVGM